MLSWASLEGEGWVRHPSHDCYNAVFIRGWRKKTTPKRFLGKYSWRPFLAFSHLLHQITNNWLYCPHSDKIWLRQWALAEMGTGSGGSPGWSTEGFVSLCTSDLCPPILLTALPRGQGLWAVEVHRLLHNCLSFRHWIDLASRTKMDVVSTHLGLISSPKLCGEVSSK